MKRIRLSLCLIVAGCFAASLYAQSVTTNHLAVWLKADAGVATNSLGQVFNWSDQSGQHNDATANEAPYGGKATYVANGCNGLPVLRFDGGSNGVSLVLTNRPLNLSRGVSIFLVALNANRRNFNGLIRAGPSNPFTPGNPAGSLNDDLEIYWSAGHGSTTNSGAPHYLVNLPYKADKVSGFLLGYDVGPATNNYYLYDVVASAGGATQRVDLVDVPGAISGAVFVPTNTASCVTIGIGYPALYSYALDGNIAELILYDAPLAFDDRVLVESYLYQKWIRPRP